MNIKIKTSVKHNTNLKIIEKIKKHNRIRGLKQAIIAYFSFVIYNNKLQDLLCNCKLHFFQTHCIFHKIYACFKIPTLSIDTEDLMH